MHNYHGITRAEFERAVVDSLRNGNEQLHQLQDVGKRLVHRLGLRRVGIAHQANKVLISVIIAVLAASVVTTGTVRTLSRWDLRQPTPIIVSPPTP